MAVAKPRVIVHPKSFRGLPADMEGLFTETLAAPKDGAIHHMVHVQSGVVRQGTARYLIRSQQTWAKPAISGYFNARPYIAVLARKRYRTAKIRRRPAGAAQGRRHPGARQGQIHR